MNNLLIGRRMLQEYEASQLTTELLSDVKTAPNDVDVLKEYYYSLIASTTKKDNPELSTNDRGLQELNQQLERYYNHINENDYSVDLSDLYLERIKKWPKTTDVLSINGANEDVKKTLMLLDERDELCHKILSVQHCIILSKQNRGNNKRITTVNINKSDQYTKEDENGRDDKDVLINNLTEENNKLTKLIELYISELARLYNK